MIALLEGEKTGLQGNNANFKKMEFAATRAMFSNKCLRGVGNPYGGCIEMRVKEEEKKIKKELKKERGGNARGGDR